MAPRDDGRKALLVYLDPAVIRRLKMAALERDTHAYLLVEEAVSRFLAAEDAESGPQHDQSHDN